MAGGWKKNNELEFEPRNALNTRKNPRPFNAKDKYAIYHGGKATCALIIS
jgi:hypothetical protein